MKPLVSFLIFWNLLINSAQALSFVPKKYDTSFKGNKTLASYQEAKKQMVNIYASIPSLHSLYCSCRVLPNKTFDRASCNYQPHRPYTKKGKPNVRTTRLEAEHILPASRFGGQLNEWKNWKEICKKGGGRKCAETTKNPSVDMKRYNGDSRSMYLYAESDLYNLRFAIGEVNADRSNFFYVEKISPSKKSWKFGGCKMTIAKNEALPVDNFSRGTIARSSLYMEWAYGRFLGFKLAPNQKILFEKWNKKYPPRKEEITYAKRVEVVQGNSNPFIRSYSTIKN